MVGQETGGDVVQALCANAEARIWMSAVNLSEVYYILLRRRGESAAGETERAVQRQDNISVVDATWERARAAATIKARGGLSLADAFAAALAREQDAVLVTDDPEYRALEAAGDLRILWLGSPPA